MGEAEREAEMLLLRLEADASASRNARLSHRVQWLEAKLANCESFHSTMDHCMDKLLEDITALVTEHPLRTVVCPSQESSQYTSLGDDGASPPVPPVVAEGLPDEKPLTDKLTLVMARVRELKELQATLVDSIDEIV